MEEGKSILHELYVYSEWKPEPEYIQKPDGILPENISALWRWLKFFGPKKSLIDSVTTHLEKQQKWHIALGDEGKVIAVLTDNILEIRTKRSEYATIAARTTVIRDAYPQWRKLVWSPDCSFVVLAYGNGVVGFFDLTASNLFNIPIDCSRPGGLECTDNTHAVADIIFMPLRVKDTKWNWEVLIVTYDGKLRGYLVSQTDGFKLHNTFRFPGGVSAVTYCTPHATLYVAGVPRGIGKDPSSPLTAGITAWRILNDDPFYGLSVVSDELEAQLANQRFQLYIPLIYSKNLAFIVQMELSPDGSKLVCLHCNGDVSVWRLPLLKLLYRWPLYVQPRHDLRNPLTKDDQTGKKDISVYYAADVNWWSNEEIILSRFSGAVSVCHIEKMENILGKKPEFFQGTPQITCAHDGTFMVLECESNVLPAKKSRSDESMEVVNIETDTEDTMLDLTKELFKSVLYAITDIETFQPKPRRITVVSRVYRLLGVKSTTPNELFSRKIESGNYKEALALADTFNLDSDLVYQQQWRKNPVSTETIQKYLSKVTKKIWAVHQCVDRLPETLAAAKELLQFGLELTNEKILNEINKEREKDPITDPEAIILEDLNAYTSELLRCRHVMLFYRERLRLYEAILRCEKSLYVRDEYDRLRSNSIVYSAIAIAKEGRIEALTCLWPHIKTTSMQLAVLEKLPETINPMDYQHLLPMMPTPNWFEKRSPIKVPPCEQESDWCRKEIFRSIWSSNWSEDTTPENETAGVIPVSVDMTKWYERRAREIEHRSGLVSHALTLISIAVVDGGIHELHDIMFHLLTLDSLVYDVNIEGLTLAKVQGMSVLDTCKMMMKNSTEATFVEDLRLFVAPFLKRYESITQRKHLWLNGFAEYLESISVDDLSYILLVLQSPKEFELDVRTHLELAERCLYSYNGTDQLDKACDLLNVILKDTDGSISAPELVRRVTEIERIVAGSSRMAWRGVLVPPRDLLAIRHAHSQAHNLLTRLARSCALGEEKPTQEDWESVLKDILELQSTIFECLSKQECYEIYASSLLTSGDAATIKLAAEVLTCEDQEPNDAQLIDYERTIDLVLNASREYFNSASTLADPALELAKSCLVLIKDDNPEIQSELDLISALNILKCFDLSILPIQVGLRLCEDKMSLIEECLKADKNAYQLSHKLLELAALLRIADDDERAREGQVLQLVGEVAIAAGPAGGAAAAAAARRLAALRYSAAAPLMAHVAREGHTHADLPSRRSLLAASLAHCKPADLEEMLRDRLGLEIEGLQRLGMTAKQNQHLSDRCPSADDEFSDAVTTPVIEKKDLVAPPKKKKPLFNYLLDTIQDKFAASGDHKSTATEVNERAVHLPEFYRSLYPEHEKSPTYYSYDRFSIPDAMDGRGVVDQSVLKWYFVQNALENGVTQELEFEVMQKCAEQILYKDTPLSVACFLRSTHDFSQTKRFINANNTDTAVSCALYATLIKCNTADLKDDVYYAKPVEMAKTTLEQYNASDEQIQLIRQCVERLSGMGEVESLRSLGHNVNGLLFNADEDYRREIIYRVARSPNNEAMERAYSLAKKYELDAVEVWLQHASVALPLGPVATDLLPTGDGDLHARIKEALWPQISGTDHNTLINLFTLLKKVDEKAPVAGLTAVEHIKLLKKAKSACSELDYKLLLEQPSTEAYLSHVLSVLRPENVGMVGKFLRALPPSFRTPVPVNVVYTSWLTKYFFSVPNTSANKKWMQQYRQCASYFNKLSKEDLLRFVADTCFTDDAVERVPAGTRNLMIMQAVDYCQQEQENEFKSNKNEQTWAQVGQELTRWARFLENFHSSTIQSLIDNSGVPRQEIWPEIEKSHGDTEKIVSCVARLVMAADVKPATLSTLLQCLHVDADSQKIFDKIAQNYLNNILDVQTVATRLTQYHKEGVKFSEDLIEAVMRKASQYGLPPHKQIGLLSLSQRTRVQDSDDITKVAQFSVDLFKTEWADSDYGKNLAEDSLVTEEGRRETFNTFLQLSDTWQKKKALVDVLNCWPPNRNSDVKSLHCQFLNYLLSETTQRSESLVLIKMLLRHPVLAEEEVKWLAANAPGPSVINTIWIILLSKCEQCRDDITQLVIKNKEFIEAQEIEDDLIKELLDNEMFLKLVSTPLYNSVINYIVSKESLPEESSNPYTVQWATKELFKSNHLAEAGHLGMLAMGVPTSLRSFSQSILYCKNLLK